MRKTFKYRIYPSRSQRTRLLIILGVCRWLYNHFLRARKEAWETNKESLSLYDQHSTLSTLKKNFSFLKQVHSQVLQNVGVRVDLTFKAFFRRIKRGEKPGYPRFKAKGRYSSFTYPQSGWKILEDKSSIKLSKVGRVKAILHRPVEGQVRTCTVQVTPTGKWFVSFSCEVEPKPLSPSVLKVGIDVGLTSFATFSGGIKVDNPRFYRRDEKDLARAQRGEKWKVVRKIHERIVNRRSDFVHKISRTIINSCGLVAVEDLSINKMLEKNPSCLNKSIMDAAWRMFLDQLSFKAVEAGRIFVKVNPAYTSQDCSRCGYRQTKKLSERTHKCSCCGLKMDRDHNAPLNILALGLQSLGNQSLEAQEP